MSKLGKGTRSLLGKWKSHSQSVDASSPQNPVAKGGICGPMSDSLDGGIGHASDPGSIDGQAFAVEKTTIANGTTNTKKNAKAAKNQSRQSSQTTAAEDKPKYSWSEHVWTAWVHRGFTDDVTEITTIQPGGDQLTDFQKDKFRYFFLHVLDLNSDFVISAEDFEKLNERMRHYMDWSMNSIHYLALKELHETFLDCFLTTASNFAAKKDDGFDWCDPFKRLDTLYDQKMENVTLADVLYGKCFFQ